MHNTMQSRRTHSRTSSLKATFPFFAYADQILLAIAAVTLASLSPYPLNRKENKVELKHLLLQVFSPIGQQRPLRI